MDTNINCCDGSIEDLSFAEELSSGAFVIDPTSTITSRIFFTEFTPIIQRSLNLSDTLNIPVAEEPVNRENTKFLNSFINTQRAILEQIIVVAPKNAFEQNIVAKLQEETRTEELETLTDRSRKNAFEHFFPDLSERLKISDVLNLSEVYDYTKTRLIEPKERLPSRAKANPFSFLRDLNSFFSKLGTSLFTKFRSLYSDIFGAIQNVRNITRDIADYAKFLQNTIKNTVEKAKKLIDSITNIEKTIENALKESENILDLLINAFDALAGALGFISSIIPDSSGLKKVSVELDETSANTYIETANTIFDTTLGVDVKEPFDRLKGFASNLSNAKFGLTELTNFIKQAKTNIEFISNLIKNPEEFIKSWFLDVSGIRQFIESVSSQAKQIMNTIETSFKSLYTDLVSTVESVIDIAQQVSTTQPQRTREMSEAHQGAVQEASDAFSRMNNLRKLLIDDLVLEVRVAEQDASAYAAGSSMENLSRSLKQTAENTLKSVRNIIENFDLSVFYNDENKYVMLARLLTISNIIQLLILSNDEELIKRTINELDGRITATINHFRDVRDQESRYVLAVFSQLSNTIKTTFNELLEPIETAISHHIETQRNLTVIGPSERAISAGANRIPSDRRYEQDERARNVPASASVGGGTPDGGPPVYPTEGPIGKIPLYVGHDTPSYNQARSGSNRFGIIYTGSDKFNGWNNIDELAMKHLLTVALEWKKLGNNSLQILSAWRSSTSNRDANGAGGSFHMIGQAFDCGIIGINNQLQFCNLAYNVGFKGIGVYGPVLPGQKGGLGFVHIDIGGQRDWATSGSSRTKTPFGYYSNGDITDPETSWGQARTRAQNSGVLGTSNDRSGVVRRLTGPLGRRVFI